MDILAIRDRLNAEPFRQGRRQVRVAWRLPGTGDLQLDDDAPRESPSIVPAPQLAAFLGRLRDDLQGQGLQLTRGPADANDLDESAYFASQVLRQDTSRDMTWMREAVNWVARITTVGLEMVLPGLGGLWLDSRFGTHFLGALGFAVGVALGLWQMVKFTRPN